MANSLCKAINFINLENKANVLIIEVISKSKVLIKYDYFWLEETEKITRNFQNRIPRSKDEKWEWRKRERILKENLQFISWKGSRRKGSQREGEPRRRTEKENREGESRRRTEKPDVCANCRREGCVWAWRKGAHCRRGTNSVHAPSRAPRIETGAQMHSDRPSRFR